MSSRSLNQLSIDAEIADRLERDDAFRRRYVRFFAQAEVAAEIRSLRKRRGLKQAELAALAKTGQSAISRIEKAGYEGWTYKTLIGIAEELRARLRITFEPIEDVIAGYRQSGASVDEAAIQYGAATTDDDVTVIDGDDDDFDASDIKPGSSTGPGNYRMM